MRTEIVRQIQGIAEIRSKIVVQMRHERDFSHNIKTSNKRVPFSILVQFSIRDS